MLRLKKETVFSLFFLFQLYECNAVTEIKANRLASYDGLSCPQTDVLFEQTDVRSRIECVTRCSGLPDCSCVFYKPGYCQGCHGMCHHGITFPTISGTTYYYIKERFPAIMSDAGAFTLGTKYYMASNYLTTRQNASSYCNNLGATLVYIETKEELESLADQLGEYYYWSDGIFNGSQYVWSHSGAPINMTLFATGEPNADDACVGLWQDQNYELDDYICGYLAHFICKSF